MTTYFVTNKLYFIWGGRWGVGRDVPFGPWWVVLQDYQTPNKKCKHRHYSRFDVEMVLEFIYRTKKSRLHNSNHRFKLKRQFCSLIPVLLNSESRKINEVVVCCQMLDFETSNSNSEVSKSNSWKITSFSKTTSLQRESRFSQCFIPSTSPYYSLPSEVLCC